MNSEWQATAERDLCNNFLLIPIQLIYNSFRDLKAIISEKDSIVRIWFIVETPISKGFFSSLRLALFIF